MWKSSPEIDMASQKAKKDPGSHSLDELGEMMKKSMSSIFSEDGRTASPHPPSFFVRLFWLTISSLTDFYHSGSCNSPKPCDAHECFTRWGKFFSFFFLVFIFFFFHFFSSSSFSFPAPSLSFPSSSLGLNNLVCPLLR